MSSAQPHTLRFTVATWRKYRRGENVPHWPDAISLSAARNPAGYYQALDLCCHNHRTRAETHGTVTFLDGTNVMAP
jgi:hypothetical protein